MFEGLIRPDEPVQDRHSYPPDTVNARGWRLVSHVAHGASILARLVTKPQIAVLQGEHAKSI